MLRSICLSVAVILAASMTEEIACAQAGGSPEASLWSEQLGRIEEQLHQSQWEVARHMAQDFFENVVERSGGTLGDKREHADALAGATTEADRRAEGSALGRAAAFLAIAEAATERREDARWHWYLAQNLLGNLSSIQLQQYKKSAEFLQQHTLIEGHKEFAGKPDVVDPVRPEPTYAVAFREPERTRVVYPYLPRDLRGRDRFSHVVFVEISIDRTGHVSQPVVVDGGFYPGLTWRAFDALREWRYRPATLDGRPTSFRFVVPVAFADDRAALPLVEWGAPTPSLSVIPMGYALNQVAGLSSDLKSGTLYVVDSADSRVLRSEPRAGGSRVAGTGTPGFNGDDLAALGAQLNQPAAISYDQRTGEVFVADTRNYRIRKISPKEARLVTVVGVGIRGVSPQRIPYESRTPEALAVGRFSGDGGPAAEAELNLPSGICADPYGILFIADSGNHRIRAVNRGTSPVIVLGVEIEPGQIKSVAGTGTVGFSGDGGKAIEAQFAFPAELKVDAAGNLLVLDTFNNRIRRIDRQSGIIRTLAKSNVTTSTERALVSWSTSIAGFGILADQDIIYADRSDHTVHRLSRSGEDHVIYTALPREGEFTGVEVGPDGEIYIAEKGRVGVLYLENSSALRYLAGGSRPLPKRAVVQTSLGN